MPAREFVTRHVHQLWMGPELPPIGLVPLMGSAATFARETGQEYTLWDYDALAKVPHFVRLTDLAETDATRSALGRLCVLAQVGGLYLDCDVELLSTRLHLFQRGYTFFTAGANNAGHYAPGQDFCLYIAAGSPAQACLREILEKSTFGPGIFAMGHFILMAVAGLTPLTILPPRWTPWSLPDRPLDRARLTEETILIHHAQGSWHSAARAAGILEPEAQPTETAIATLLTP